ETIWTGAGKGAAAATVSLARAGCSAALDWMAPAPMATAKTLARNIQDLTIDISFPSGRRLSWRRNCRRGYVLEGSANRSAGKGSGDASKPAFRSSNWYGSDEMSRIGDELCRAGGEWRRANHLQLPLSRLRERLGEG